MLYQIFLLIVQYVFYNQYEFVHSEPIIGVNTRQANPNEFPFVVPIKFINNTNPEPEKDFLCTGIIVSRKFILSVSHSLIHVPTARMEVLVGSIDLRNGRKFYPVQIITYEMWAAFKHITLECNINDLSLLKLSEAIPNEFMSVILSPMPNNNLYGYDVVTAGWGRTNVDRPSRYLQTVSLTILDKIECKRRIENITRRKTNIHEMFLCTAAEPFAFIRNGDSGGPLLLYGELVAVNKGTCPYEENNFNPEKVNIHTGIDCYRYFIVDVTNNFS